ncbi:MAG: hypothetical protein K0U41_08475 [Gammaproteobacteria bacterium]|nr:hypothetical protein [Gammaproteobacteria bacterium]
MASRPDGFYARGERRMNWLRWYRVVRKYFGKKYNLTDPDIELLIFLDDEMFTRTEFKDGTLTQKWEDAKFKRLVDTGWIVKFRDHDPSKRAGAKYRTSQKSRSMVSRIYRILAGEEDIPLANGAIR